MPTVIPRRPGIHGEVSRAEPRRPGGVTWSAGAAAGGSCGAFAFALLPQAGSDGVDLTGGKPATLPAGPAAATRRQPADAGSHNVPAPCSVHTLTGSKRPTGRGEPVDGRVAGAPRGTAPGASTGPDRVRRAADPVSYTH